MSTVTTSIEVNVPVRTAYNQWTQFEEFPQFMEGVKEIQQLNDRRLHWKAEIGGREKEWDAEITEQIPDQRIAWKSGRDHRCQQRGRVGEARADNHRSIRPHRRLDQ